MVSTVLALLGFTLLNAGSPGVLLVVNNFGTAAASTTTTPTKKTTTTNQTITQEFRQETARSRK